MIQLATNPVSQKSAAPVPASVMDNLAARFRPGGLCLLVLNPDGSLAYHDSTAGLFFQRYAVPMVQYGDPGAKLAEKVAAIAVNSAVEVWNILPGVVIAAFPYVENRNLIGVMLLTGKISSLRLGEQVPRLRSRLGIHCIRLYE